MGKKDNQAQVSRNSQAARQPPKKLPEPEQDSLDELEEGIEEGELDDGFEEGFEEGMEEGMEEGFEEGMDEGLEEGMEEGMEDGLDMNDPEDAEFRHGMVGRSDMPEGDDFDGEGKLTANQIWMVSKLMKLWLRPILSF